MNIILPAIMLECFPLHAISHIFSQNLSKEILWPVSSVITGFKVEINSGFLAGLIKFHFVGGGGGVGKSSGVRSGWQRSRKRSLPSSTKTLKIHLQVKHFTLYSYKAMKEDARCLKKTRKCPHNWIGQKSKEKEGIRMGPAPQGGNCKGGIFPILGKSSH